MHTFIVITVVNLYLLKCRKLRREDQETSGWIGLKSQSQVTLQGLIGIFGGGTFGGGDKFKQRMQLREALVCYQTSRGSNLINIIVFQMHRH